MPLVAYGALFSLLLGSRPGTFATHLPTWPNAYDAQLIVWILSWVAHALGHAPATLFDANINYPSPAQLTGSDYFLSCQLLFAPVALATGNPILATNLAALATYCLAGLACERLLRALGCDPGIAFVSGLLFALGPLRMPFNVHVLQYPNFFLPWVALATTRLRERPDVRHAALLALAFACAAFTSLYTATMVGVVGLMWAAAEGLRAGRGRLRYFLLGLVAALVAAAPLWLVLRVYLTRAQHQGLAAPRRGTGLFLGIFAFPQGYLTFDQPSDAVLTLLSLLSLLAFFARIPIARRLVPVAVAMIAVGGMLAAGLPPALGNTALADVFRVVRYAHRFAVLLGFGDVLLFAAALTCVATLLGRRGRLLLALAALLLVVLGKGVQLNKGDVQEIVALGRDRAVHEQVGALVRDNGAGPMLVLPTRGFPAVRSARTSDLNLDAMLASTLHWQPLIDGYTGHQPAHRLLLSRETSALPDEAALDDLIDMTHLKWILLRPASAWPEEQQRAAMQTALLASPAMARAWGIGDWLLIELGRTPKHPGWFETIARGGDEGATVLGTPLTPLPKDAAVGQLTLLSAVPTTFSVKNVFPVSLVIRNAGSATWPAMPAPESGLVLDLMLATDLPHRDVVMLIERWIPVDPGSAQKPQRREIWLRRDLLGGESLVQKVLVVSPPQPGIYTLELSLEQIDGARFDGPGNLVIQQQVRVVPAPAKPAPPVQKAPGDAS